MYTVTTQATCACVRACEYLSVCLCVYVCARAGVHVHVCACERACVSVCLGLFCFCFRSLLLICLRVRLRARVCERGSVAGGGDGGKDVGTEGRGARPGGGTFLADGRDGRTQADASLPSSHLRSPARHTPSLAHTGAQAHTQAK